MDIQSVKDIVDSMYNDFDWYASEFTERDLAKFKKLFYELWKELEKE